jgi:hypothetical protein
MYNHAMGRMIRKQIYIEPHHQTILKREARRQGVSEADLIRRGIEKIADASGGPLDLAAWEESKKVIKERMKLQIPQTGRTWTREELYEERLERFSRR